MKSLTGSGKAARQLRPGRRSRRPGGCAAEHAEVVWRLRAALKPRLPFARVTRVYETMERPLVPVLAAMEAHGVRVDRQALSRLSGDFAQRMAALEAEIHGLAGGPFNVGSPKQLGEVLFDQMGLGGGRKGKTGAYSTGADVLEELAAQGHDLPARVLDWRLLSKLKSTYTDTLQDAINPETGRVHTCLHRSPAPPPGGSPRPIRTCRTSRSAPRRAGASARPSSPSRATCWSASTTARSSCASSRTWPTSRR